MGGPREMNAETKIYEVPRELIEIARARANSKEATGTVTPIAPRPGPDLEATLLAYTEAMSKACARGHASPEVVPVTREASVSEAPAPSEVSGDANMSGAKTSEASGAVERVEPRQASRSSEATFAKKIRAREPARPWPFYAGVSLILIYFAHFLLNS
jgi:hypothetical protein